MPTYEYICTSCKHEWEAEQSMRDEPLKKCPRCKHNTARRQMSLGGGFILKGGGWYADLYSSSKSSGSSSSSSRSSSSSSSSSGSSGSSGSSAKSASSGASHASA